MLGFRGAKDVEKPVGEWNRLEAICEGGDVTYFVNGVKVMEGRNGSFSSGKLLFQSEGAEIFFRLIELQPLPQDELARLRRLLLGRWLIPGGFIQR